MERAKLIGKAQTVLGPIDGNKLGFTLPHEHLFIDTMSWFVEPKDREDKEMARQPVSMKNLSWVRSHKTSNLDNLHLDDEKTAINEALRFQKAGGNTIVDVTPNNIARNPQRLVNVAKAAGINVIMSTAYYIEASFTPEMYMEKKKPESIAQEFIRDIVQGADSSDVCAGLIGEIGCSWPVTKNEKKVLHGAAMAQQETGAVISVHFQGGAEDAPFKIVKMLTDAGADSSRIILCHMSCELSTSARKARAKLADKGCYLEWDLFGTDGIYPLEVTPYQGKNDWMRITEIMQLIEDGFVNNILISHDTCFKIQMSAYGGMGYTHIPKTVIPLMLKRGMTEEQIRTITVENPRRALTFV